MGHEDFDHFSFVMLDGQVEERLALLVGEIGVGFTGEQSTNDSAETPPTRLSPEVSRPSLLSHLD